MCNLYSLTKGQQAIREFARAMFDRTGNLPTFPAIFPDYAAPIVRNQSGGRELAMARWGMPSPDFALKGKNCDPGVTNVRNVKSPHWRRWLGIEHRCVAPFTSFSENEALPDGTRPPVWFAFDETRPLAFFAGNLDQLDVGQESEGRRDQQRYLRISDDRAERACGSDPSESHACHSKGAGRDRPLDDSPCGGGAQAAEAAS